MRKRFVSTLLLLSLMSFSLSGCIYLVVGGIGALGGYVVSPDTVEGITENEYETVWDSALEVLSIMGVIQEQSHEGGVIITDVMKTTITVNLIPLTDSTLKIKVKARKLHLPRIATAQDVFVKIMSNVNE